MFIDRILALNENVAPCLHWCLWDMHPQSVRKGYRKGNQNM